MGNIFWKTRIAGRKPFYNILGKFKEPRDSLELNKKYKEILVGEPFTGALGPCFSVMEQETFNIIKYGKCKSFLAWHRIECHNGATEKHPCSSAPTHADGKVHRMCRCCEACTTACEPFIAGG